MPRYEPEASDALQGPPPSYREATKPPSRQGQRVQACDASCAVASVADRIPKICGCFPPTLAITLLMILIMLTLGLIAGMVIVSQFVVSQNDDNVERVGGYVKTQCTFKKKRYLDHLTEFVECGRGKYEYPCWEIKVDVDTDYQLYPSIDLMQHDNYSSCVFTPPCDPSENVRQAAVENFLATYGTEGSTFICYYDDDRLSLMPFVVKPPDHKSYKRILAYAIPSVIAVLCIVCIFALCWSAGGPAGLCQKVQQQREVQQEVADGLVALGGAMRQEEAVILMQNPRQ